MKAFWKNLKEKQFYKALMSAWLTFISKYCRSLVESLPQSVSVTWLFVSKCLLCDELVICPECTLPLVQCQLGWASAHCAPIK